MRDNAIKISTNLRMVTYMKLKKLLIISLSFILASTFLITPLSASSTVSLGKYFDDGEEIYSYVDKNTGKAECIYW